MTRCICHPAHRCGRCDEPAKPSLAEVRAKHGMQPLSAEERAENLERFLTDSQAAQLIPVWPDCDQGGES